MAANRTARAATNAYLSDLSVKYALTGMVADRLAPRVKVAKKSAIYRIWGRNIALQHKADWSPGTIPNAIDFAWSSDTYNAEEYKLRTPLTDSERANADSDLDLEEAASEFVTAAITIAREKRVATLFTTSSNYPAGNVITKTGGAEWNASTPGEGVITDLKALRDAIALAAGVAPSDLTVAIPQSVFSLAVERNTAILDSVKYSERGIMTEALLASVLGVKEVIRVLSFTVGAGPVGAGADVVTGYTPAYLWNDTVWMGVVDGSSPNAPTFARSFNWTQVTGGQERQVRAYRNMDEGTESDWYECKEAIAEKVVFSSAGGIILNTLV